MARPLRLPNVAEQAVLDGLVVRLIVAGEEPRWNQEITQRHYLKNARLVGEQLRYVAEYQGQWLALLGWSAATFHVKGRDVWLGWTAEQRRTRRPFLAQNSRFLILTDRHQLPNLASRALALCCQRFSGDWLAGYGHPIVAVESFVDAQITFGTAYKASGWTMLGGTAGFGRSAQDFYERHNRPKQLWVKALDPEGTAALKAAELPPSLAVYEAKPASRCQVAAPRLPSLLERLPQVRDPRGRQGRRHGWGGVLGVLSLAKLAGVAGCQRDIANFAKRLTQPQRRQLGCWRNPDTGRYEVPSQSTIFRALAKVDYLSFEKVVLEWQNDWLGPADPEELVALDGKTLINGGHQMMVSAIGVKSGRVYGVEPVRPKDQLEPDDRPEVPAALPSPKSPVAPIPSVVPALASPSAGPAPAAPMPATVLTNQSARQSQAPACPASAPRTAAPDPVAPANPTGPAPAPVTVPASAPPAPACLPTGTSTAALTPTPAPSPTPPAKATKAKKENEIPAARRLLARADLAGKLISLDAIHTQHQTATQIVLGCGADYLFTLKANQEGLLTTAQTLVPSAFFPSGPRAAQAAYRQDRRDQPPSPRNPGVGDPPD
jgi:Domain of unknown function (DUF4338)/DDE_Tnp_1-associated